MTKYNIALNEATGINEDNQESTGDNRAMEKDNIILFPARLGIAYTETASTIDTLQYEPTYLVERKRRVPTRTQIDLSEEKFIEVSSVSRELLDSTFERISNSLDSSLTEAERSNSYDEWKDLLHRISRKSEHFSSNHRKILGSLISATKGLDITDFSNETLKLFVQTTNTLRQPRVTKPESRQMISGSVIFFV